MAMHLQGCVQHVEEFTQTEHIDLGESNEK